MMTGVGLMVSGRITEPVAPLGSRAFRVTLKTPALVAVPVSAPAVDTFRPGGKPDADQEMVPLAPVAVRVAPG